MLVIKLYWNLGVGLELKNFMKTYNNIRLNSIDKVKEFVNIVKDFNGEVTVVQKRYVVDAKSIMGLFSLNLLSDMVLEIDGEGEQDLLNQLAKQGLSC